MTPRNSWALGLGGEEVRTYSVFWERGQSRGTLAIHISVLVYNMIGAHVGVIETIPVASCGERVKMRVVNTQAKY